MNPRATILIPAFNEEALIARTLLRVSDGMEPGEFQVVVICNGCKDGTAAAAQRALPWAEVIETALPGKTNALNIGHETARAPVRVYMDADLDVDVQTLRALVAPIEAGKVSATYGHMAVDVSNSSFAVRSFYRVWALNPYLAEGKFGGLFALSAAQAELIHPLPRVTADDEFIRRNVGAGHATAVENCSFKTRAPSTLGDLLNIRRRSLRGTRELDQQGLAALETAGTMSGVSILRSLASRPHLWVSALVYYAVAIFVRAVVSLEDPDRAPRWERDDSSRRVT
ncbi:MAG: glycosyltransferase [Pseudomonadota bacterium]